MKKCVILMLFMFLSSILFHGCVGGPSVKEYPGRPAGMSLAEYKRKVALEKERISENKVRVGDCLHLIDFNNEQKTTINVARFGAWDKDPSDETQTCTFDFRKDVIFGGLSNVLVLHYDVDSSEPAYNGFYIKLRDIDLTKHRLLMISIKGNAEDGFTDRIKLEIKTRNRTGRYVLTGITNEWQMMEIPLHDFLGMGKFKDIIEFVIMFDDATSRPKVGTIYIDNLCFCKK